VHMHEIFKRIVNRGHRVTLFCSSFPGACPEETIEGIHILREGNRNIFNAFVPLRYATRFRHEKYDVIVDDINKIPFFTPLFVKEPLVGIVHHLFGKSIFAEVSLTAGLYVNLAERLAFPVYRNIPIAVVSKSTRQEMIQKKFRESNLHIVSNAIDETVFRLINIKPDPAPVIGYLGRLKKYKSVDHLLRAFSLVLKKIPNARLVIIGDGDMRESLQRLAQELCIADATTFTGYVSQEKKVSLLNRMRVVVNPSAKEGWGLTVIEANACGIPVIASNVPGLRDSIIHDRTGLLYEYGNIEQIAQNILLLLQDSSLHSRLQSEAIDWAGRFRWEISTDIMFKLIQYAIAKKQTGNSMFTDLRP